MIDATDTMRVLVADDEPSIRFVLQEVLEGLGHSVTAVDDGDAAARELGGERYDLAFLDIRMPGLTGIEVLQQHRAAGDRQHLCQGFRNAPKGDVPTAAGDIGQGDE